MSGLVVGFVIKGIEAIGKVCFVVMARQYEREICRFLEFYSLYIRQSDP
jgi:hypothetical protein